MPRSEAVASARVGERGYENLARHPIMARTFIEPRNSRRTGPPAACALAVAGRLRLDESRAVAIVLRLTHARRVAAARLPPRGALHLPGGCTAWLPTGGEVGVGAEQQEEAWRRARRHADRARPLGRHSDSARRQASRSGADLHESRKQLATKKKARRKLLPMTWHFVEVDAGHLRVIAA